ncbi:hypothetical protein [Butyrivibrio proteoclasticus]|uniref:hypothetical protein n=1 Tax=Butyrivibrio proteoclasticus TaxID=43305 RepID=UPI00047B0A20|nr:hypothetical protein [Butyrivibrio proteoclasticus]
MKKRHMIFAFILLLVLIVGVSYYNYDKNKYVSYEKNNSFFPDEGEYTYTVTKFFFEDISELTVKVDLLEAYDHGSVYQISIQYDDIPQRYYYTADRYEIGLFYVADDTIYLMTYHDEIPSEDTFLSDGMIVYSSSGEEQNPADYGMRIEYDDNSYECRFWNPLVESGYYCDMVWTKGKGLTYFRSGFGAEGDPIEIELKSK